MSVVILKDRLMPNPKRKPAKKQRPRKRVNKSRSTKKWSTKTVHRPRKRKAPSAKRKKR